MFHPPRFPCFLLSLLSVVPIATANAATLYVSQAGDNSNGATWGTAYQTIGGAVSSATDGDEVWVAGGDYYESIEPTVSISVLGGFAGAESSIEERGSSATQTRIYSAASRSGIRCDVSCDFDTLSIHGSTQAGFVTKAGVCTLRNVTIKDNTSFNGGGVVVTDTANLLIDSCTITSNDCIGGGGGIYIVRGAVVTIENSTIANNGALSGGGISINRSALSVTNSRFINNISTSGSEEAGLGGAIQISHAHVVIENCLFQNNHGTFGNQMWISGNEGPVLINNSTFYTSHFSFPDDFHIALRLGAHPIYTNCIFWGMGPIFALFDGSSVTVDHSCVLGGYPGEGNIADDPLFRDPANGDYRLQHNSPCIDAGAMAGPADDLDGNPRPIDIPGIGREGDNAFDMGAFEFQLPIPLPDPRTDINQDGLRDATDLLLLLQDWHRVSAPSAN